MLLLPSSPADPASRPTGAAMRLLPARLSPANLPLHDTALDEHSGKPPGAPRLLLFHGLLSSADEFALLTHPLRRARLDHRCVVIDGYSRITAPTANFSWQAWTDRACEEIDAVPDDGRPLVLAGLCTGGLIAAAVALRRPGRVAGLMMLSPTFRYDGWGLPWWYRLRHIGYLPGLARFFSMKERAPYGVRNERMRSFIESRMTQERSAGGVPASVPLTAVREAERLGRAVLPRLRALACPLEIVHSRLDEVSSLRGLLSALRAARCEPQRLTVLDDSYHMITVDNDRAQVAQRLSTFIADCATGRQSARTAT